MKAGVLYAQEDLRYVDVPKPEPGESDVLVKVKYTGICGSDIPRVNGTASHFYPNILGHEFSGTVESIGDKVTSVKVGQKVAGIPLRPCMQCADCMQGNYSLCKNYSFYGSREQGSFAEYIVLPEQNVMPFADEVSYEKGVFFEPATVALHGLRRVPFTGGRSVAILGGGTIGMFALQWARILGARQIVVFDIAEERLELGKRFGATEVINTLDDDFLARALALTGGKGFDYVYETAGRTETIKMGFELVCNKGYFCCIGTPTRELSFSVKEWENINRKEMFVTGSWMSYSAPFPGEEWEATAHYFGTGELQFDESLLFRIVPLSKIDEAFEMFKTPGLVKGKVLIDSEN